MSSPYQDSDQPEESKRNLHAQNEVFETNHQTGPLLTQNQNPTQVITNPSQNPNFVPYTQPQQYRQPQQPQFVQQQGYIPPHMYVQPQHSPQHGQYQNVPPNFQQGIPQQGVPQQGFAPQNQIQSNQAIMMPTAGGGMTCPVCFYSGPNNFQKANGTQVWIWLVVLIFCCLLLFWIPLVCDSCKDTKVLCAKCGYCVRTEKEC